MFEASVPTLLEMVVLRLGLVFFNPYLGLISFLRRAFFGVLLFFCAGGTLIDMVIGEQKKAVDQLPRTNDGMTAPRQPGQTSTDNHAKQCSVETIAVNSDDQPLIDPPNHEFFLNSMFLA